MLKEITGFGFLARGVVKQSIRLVFSAFRFAMDGYWRPSRLPPPWTVRPGQGLAVNQGPESLTRSIDRGLVVAAETSLLQDLAVGG